jgi:sugar lactone lactonase YvrE
MCEIRKNRQAFPLLVLASVLVPVASAQYTITTIAGGGPANGVPSTSIGLSYVTSVAIDAGGNVYVAAQMKNRIYKSSPDGPLTIIAGTGMAGFSGDNGLATNAQLNSPGAVAVDGAGNLYISDSGNARIRKVSGGIITTVAGNGLFGFAGDNGLAIDAQISGANGLAAASGILYIADSNNSRIRKVEGGVITTVAGNGIAGYFGDNGLATNAQLNYPWGVAVDTNGNLYIGDGSNYRVRKVSAGVITTVAGNGTFGFGGDNGQATNAQLGYTTGVAVDAAGNNLYIADSSNGRIRKVTGGVITTVTGGGGGCAQQTDSVGDGCPAVNASLSMPYGVALDAAGNPYIADTSNYRIRKIVSGVISTVAGNGSFEYSGDNGPAASAQLRPQGVAVKSPGNYYIADSPDYRIRYVSGGVITTVAGNGICCYNGDNIPATSAQLAFTVNVAADSTGNFYTLEDSRVRKVSAGVISAFAGTGTYGFSGDNGTATSAQLSTARGAAVDGAGNVYIADQNNNRVRKVSGGVITTVAGGGPPDGAMATSISLGQAVGVAADGAGNLYVPSYADHRIYRISTGGTITTVAGNGSSGYSGDNGPATAAQLNTPYGVAVNSAGTIVYIADRGNNRVRMVSGGVISTVAGGGSGCPQQTNPVGDSCPGTGAILNAPAVVALDSTGTSLYIADSLNYRIRKMAGGVISTVAGNGTCCYSGDGGSATAAQLNYATGIAVDPRTGDLYIGDSENFRVRMVSAGVITTVAGTGAFGYSGDNGPPTSAQLSYSYGVAVDAASALYIADAGNHRIRKVAAGTITTVAGNGVSGFSGDGGAATVAQINVPYDVALDSTGNLYIADTSNYRIRKVSGGVITTVAGNGFPSFSGDGGQATGAQLDAPSAVAVDGAGTLYISDSNNFRIRHVSAGGVITTVAGNGTYGSSGDNGPAINASIGYSPAIAADTGGNLYLADPSSR